MGVEMNSSGATVTWILLVTMYVIYEKTGWCHMKLLPSRRVLCTPYNNAPCHFMQTHIRHVHACLDVTCTCASGRMTGIFYVRKKIVTRLTPNVSPKL